MQFVAGQLLCAGVLRQHIDVLVRDGRAAEFVSDFFFNHGAIPRFSLQRRGFQRQSTVALLTGRDWQCHRRVARAFYSPPASAGTFPSGIRPSRAGPWWRGWFSFIFSEARRPTVFIFPDARWPYYMSYFAAYVMFCWLDPHFAVRAMLCPTVTVYRAQALERGPLRVCVFQCVPQSCDICTVCPAWPFRLFLQDFSTLVFPPPVSCVAIWMISVAPVPPLHRGLFCASGSHPLLHPHPPRLVPICVLHLVSHAYLRSNSGASSVGVRT